MPAKGGIAFNRFCVCIANALPVPLLVSARPEMVIFPNLFVGRKKLRTFIFLRKKIIIISGQALVSLGWTSHPSIRLQRNERHSLKRRWSRRRSATPPAAGTQFFWSTHIFSSLSFQTVNTCWKQVRTRVMALSTGWNGIICGWNRGIRGVKTG